MTRPASPPAGGDSAGTAEMADSTDKADTLRARVVELLSRHHVVTLACHDERGAWAAAVFYAHDDLDLLFLSSHSSRHIRSLAHDARLAGAIHGPAQDWRAIVGLQVAGVVDELSGAELDAARRCYAQRFPFVADEAGDDAALSAALRKSACWRLRIDEAVIVDNTKGLGSRQRWPREPSGSVAGPVAGPRAAPSGASGSRRRRRATGVASRHGL